MHGHFYDLILPFTMSPLLPVGPESGAAVRAWTEWTRSELADVAERATTVWEHLAGGRSTHSRGIEKESYLVQPRLARWCAVTAEGDWEVFKRILSFDGLTLDDVRHAVTPILAATPADPAIPKWLAIIQAGLAEPLAEDGHTGSDPTDSERRTAPIARFGAVWDGMISLARRMLRDRAGDRYRLLSARAHATLEQSLRLSLNEVSYSSLELEFRIHATCTRHSGHASFGTAEIDREQEFVAALQQGGMRDVLFIYPMLARLSGGLILSWLDVADEFLSRLQRDLAALEDFMGGGTLDAVESLEVGLSDRHRGGRTVMVLSFGSNRRVVYKPRGLGIDNAFNRCVCWCNERGLRLQLRACRVLERSEYGWAEYIEFIEFRDQEERRTYYERCGMLLALSYVLGAIDLHVENVIRSGAHPVLVDVETLMHPEVRYHVAGEATSGHPGNPIAYDSLLRTGLLPVWYMGKLQAQNGLSGFAGHGRRIKSGGPHDQPSRTSDGAYGHEVQCFHGEILNGFETMYQMLSKHREELVSENGPLESFFDQQIRFVFRTTSAYATILWAAIKPRHLRDGMDFSLALERLASVGKNFPECPFFWPILTAERQALTSLDIPRFVTTPNAAVLSGRAVPELGEFLRPSRHAVRNRTANLSDADLGEQKGLITGSLYSRREFERFSHRLQAAEADAQDFDTSRASESYVETARRIGIELGRASVRDANDTTWIVPRVEEDAAYAQFTCVGPHLYDGKSGIVLFLSALAKVTEEPEFRTLAKDSLRSIRHRLHDPGSHSSLGIGGGIGYGSLVYALTRISQMLGDEAILADATVAASLITERSIQEDRRFDVMWGTAGTILGLLSLYEQKPDGNLVAVALRCARHLAEHQTSGPNGGAAWPTLNGRLQTGFSHGAAGIAYALLRLFRATGETWLWNAGRDAIAFETGVFSSQEGNWPDFRDEMSVLPVFGTTWCNGFPGIGLARLGVLDVMDSSQIRGDISAALAGTLDAELHDRDHICCGNMGLVELLFYAGSTLEQPELTEAAHALAARVLRRAARNGGAFQLGPLPVFLPPLFQGASGVGYQLLRLAHPDQVPSVALWQ
jgi:type 2 lantibiotic biosynthesis protein LanM